MLRSLGQRVTGNRKASSKVDFKEATTKYNKSTSFYKVNTEKQHRSENDLALIPNKLVKSNFNTVLSAVFSETKINAISQSC